MHRTDLTLQTDGPCYLEVGEAIHLGLTQQDLVERVDILTFQLLVDVDDMLQFIEEPLVDLRQLVDALDGIFRQMHGLRDHKHTLIRRLPEGGVDIGDLQLLVLHESVHALSDHA